jgi:tetratricopeptide (TPR) repeat protein
MVVLIVLFLAIGVFGGRAADLGNYSDAAKYYHHTAEVLIAKGKQAEAGAIYMELGEEDQIHGLFSTAEVDFKQGLDLLKRYAQPNDLRLVTAMDDLGWLYITWGKAIEGSRLMNLAWTRAVGADPNDPLLIRHLDSQAAYKMIKGRYSEAQTDWNRALEIGKLNFGPNNPKYDNIFLHFGQAGVLYGDYDVAAQMLRRFLEIEHRASNKWNTSQAVAAAELGNVYVHLHKLFDARAWLDQAAGVFENNPDDVPLIHSLVLSYFGDYYMAQEDWNNAQLKYRQALNLQRSVLGENKAVAASMISLSKALAKLHMKDEAKNLVVRAKAIIVAQSDPLQKQTVDVLALQHQ